MCILIFRSSPLFNIIQMKYSIRQDLVESYMTNAGSPYLGYLASVMRIIWNR